MEFKPQPNFIDITAKPGVYPGRKTCQWVNQKRPVIQEWRNEIRTGVYRQEKDLEFYRDIQKKDLETDKQEFLNSYLECIKANQDNIPPSDINVVPSANGSIVKSGSIQSPSFKSGSSGWRIDSKGNAEFNDGNFRGTFKLGGTIITVNAIGNLQTAIDSVSDAGGGSVNLSPGTYYPTTNIDIPSNVSLVGVSLGGTIIDFNSQAYSIRFLGSNNYSTGSVSVTFGATTVTGSGTSWTSAMVGRNILLSGEWYPISSVNVGAQTLEVGLAYGDTTLTNATYMIATTVDNTSISNMTIQGSTSAAITVTYAKEFYIKSVNIYTSTIGIDMDYVSNWEVYGSDLVGNGNHLTYDKVYYGIMYFCGGMWSTGVGYLVTDSHSLCFPSNFILKSGDDGMRYTNCDDINLNRVCIRGSGANGINLASGDTNIMISALLAKSNVGSGLVLTATSDECIITGSICKLNGSYGMRVADSSCDNNIITNCINTGNTTGQLSDSGTNTLMANNI